MVQQASNSRGLLFPTLHPSCWAGLSLTFAAEKLKLESFPVCALMSTVGNQEANPEALGFSAVFSPPLFCSFVPGPFLKGVQDNCYSISHCVNGGFGQILVQSFKKWESLCFNVKNVSCVVVDLCELTRVRQRQNFLQHLAGAVTVQVHQCPNWGGCPQI